MSDVGKRESRILTGCFLVLAGACVAASVSPTVEATLNLWIGVPVVVSGALVLGWLLVRGVWSWLADRKRRRS